MCKLCVSMFCCEITHVAGQVLHVTEYRACPMELVTQRPLSLSIVSCRSDLSFSIDMLPIAAEVAMFCIHVCRKTNGNKALIKSRKKAFGSPFQLAEHITHYSSIAIECSRCIHSCQTQLTFSEYLNNTFIKKTKATPVTGRGGL
jgi:hypothetical protein